MTMIMLLKQLVEIGRQLRECDETEEELLAYYTARIDQQEIRCVMEDNRLLAFVDFRWIPEPSPKWAQDAYYNLATAGPCLYIKTVYVVQGASQSMWLLRSLLPFHNVLCGHAQSDNGTLQLRTHWRPYARILRTAEAV